MIVFQTFKLPFLQRDQWFCQCLRSLGSEDTAMFAFLWPDFNNNPIYGELKFYLKEEFSKYTL